MTVIGFIRHGVTAWNKEGRAQGNTDVPLDLEGIEMAQKLALRLANEQWQVLFTSPLLRAKQTAEIISTHLQSIPLIEDDRLRERSGGLIEGTTEQERLDKWGRNWRELDLERESDVAVTTRSIDFVEDVRRRFPNDRILVVSHGSLLKRLFIHLQLLDRHEQVVIPNTSLTIVEWSHDGSFNRLLFNCTKH